MLQAEHLTKYYGEFKAVDDLTFTVGNGKVYGSLGPNGAGKSTTRNMCPPRPSALLPCCWCCVAGLVYYCPLGVQCGAPPLPLLPTGAA